MFTVDTLVDNAVKQTKSVFTYIPNNEVRSNLETLVEAQAAYTKTVYSATTDLVKLATDHLAAFNPTKVAKK